ncbi:hypothetical protein CDD81_5171 [Ophiocordyceps australis]|uniref:Uncharacterized protein n=1 Tax=Ophiocordyceps australis TaxID=1399860 RepID=A0A2C5Y9N0_9HYPO|nr:hypothetical protein CDD81_5171 [Ophiocordyceps australis]
MIGPELWGFTEIQRRRGSKCLQCPALHIVGAYTLQEDLYQAGGQLERDTQAPSRWLSGLDEADNGHGVSHAELMLRAQRPRPSFEDIVDRRDREFCHKSAKQYYDLASQVCQIVKRGRRLWREKDPDNNFEAPDLHDIGCILARVPQSLYSEAMTVGFWASASYLSYRPSILSLVRQLMRREAYGRMKTFAVFEASFREILRTNKDPDALFIVGEMCFRLKKFAECIDKQRAALALQNVRFGWRMDAELCMAKALCMLGRHEEAVPLLLDLSEQGLAEADLELGDIYRSRDPKQAYQHYYAAACRGKSKALHHLSEISFDLGEETGFTIEEANLWTINWVTLAEEHG